MTIDKIHIGDTASETYLVSDYYTDATDEHCEFDDFFHIKKDGTMFLFIYKNGVSEEDILKFKSEPLKFCVIKLPSMIQLFHIRGPVELTLLPTENLHTIRAVLKEGNEELYMVLVDTKTDKIVALRNAELPYSVRKGIFTCKKSTVQTGITDLEKLKKAVMSELSLLSEKKIAPHITYLGQEIQNKFPTMDIFISD